MKINLFQNLDGSKTFSIPFTSKNAMESLLSNTEITKFLFHPIKQDGQTPTKTRKYMPVAKRGQISPLLLYSPAIIIISLFA